MRGGGREGVVGTGGGVVWCFNPSVWRLEKDISGLGRLVELNGQAVN